MSKYDFGYGLEEGSTNAWAFHVVAQGTDVLELGPSVGSLTRHLAQEKRCRVDIVEIDEEAGCRAAQFADLALTGEKGDLNGRLWIESLMERGRRYDYIVILDVLEHLQDPEHTLKLAMALLKESGKAVLSIPNAAHNSVLINAFHNRFEYTQLGLLDCTHVHLFAYEDMAGMLQRLGLHIYVLDAVVKAVGTNEIANSYGSLPEGLGYFFRTRKHAEVYQYLIVAGTGCKSMDDRIKAGISDRSLYQSVALVNGLGKNEVVARGTLESIDMRINLQNYGSVHDIRFLPVGQQCIVRELTAYGQTGNQMVRVSPNWTGGIQVGERDFVLPGENYEINFRIQENYDVFYIRCSCSLLGAIAAEMFTAFKEKMDSVSKGLEADKGQLQSANQALQEEGQRLQSVNQKLQEEQQYLQSINQDLKEARQQLQSANQALEADKHELSAQNEILQAEQQALKAQIANLEAEVSEYRKLWYVRLRDRLWQRGTKEK